MSLKRDPPLLDGFESAASSRIGVIDVAVWFNSNVVAPVREVTLYVYDQ